MSRQNDSATSNSQIPPLEPFGFSVGMTYHSRVIPSEQSESRDLRVVRAALTHYSADSSARSLCSLGRNDMGRGFIANSVGMTIGSFAPGDKHQAVQDY